MRGRVADRSVVPAMAAKATSRPEGRLRRVGNPGEGAQGRTQGRTTLPANLARVNEAAKRSRQTRFTARLHQLSWERAVQCRPEGLSLTGRAAPRLARWPGLIG